MNDPIHSPSHWVDDAIRASVTLEIEEPIRSIIYYWIGKDPQSMSPRDFFSEVIESGLAFNYGLLFAAETPESFIEECRWPEISRLRYFNADGRLTMVQYANCYDDKLLTIEPWR